MERETERLWQSERKSESEWESERAGARVIEWQNEAKYKMLK